MSGSKHRQVCSIVTLVALLTGCSYRVVDRPLHWSLENGLCDPETVIHDPARDLLIVSNICQFKANGEGYLSLVSPDGQIHTERWVDGLNAPAGMAIHHRRLYIADLDRVQVVDLDQGAVVDTLVPTPAAKTLNDIAVGDDGTVFVSDSASHRVLQMSNGNWVRLQPTFRFANGLHLSGDTLWVGGDRLWQVTLTSGVVETIRPNQLIDIDGIDPDGAGGLTISQVGGSVWRLSADGKLTRWQVPRVSSANHGFIAAHQLIVVPTGFDDTLLAFKTVDSQPDR